MQAVTGDLARQVPAGAGAPWAAPPAAAPSPAAASDKLDAFFDAGDSFATKYVGPFLLSDFAFFLSVLLVLQWHVRFHLGDLLYRLYEASGPLHPFTKRETKPMMTARRLGMNVLILGIYYDSDLPGRLGSFVKPRPFVASIALVFLDNVVLFYAFKLLGFLLSPTARDEGEWINPLDEAEDDGITPEKSQATNVFEDLTVKFRKAFATWFVQVMLVAFYIEELNSSASTKELDNVSFLFWAAAVAFQMTGGDAQVGEACNMKYWQRVTGGESALKSARAALWRLLEGAPAQAPRPSAGASARQALLAADPEAGEAAGPDVEAGRSSLESREDVLRARDALEQQYAKSFGSLGELQNKVFWIFDMRFQTEWQIRSLMDFSVNAVARSIILYTVPIMVCVEGPLDFVKDLTAIMFITTLDNLSEPRDIWEMLVRLKFGVHHSGKGHVLLWDWVKQLFGYGLAKHLMQSVDLSQEERDYIEDNKAKFQRFADLVPEEWRSFRGRDD